MCRSSCEECVDGLEMYGNRVIVVLANGHVMRYKVF